MLDYDTLKQDERKFVALTGITPAEFQRLLPAFTRAYARAFPATTTQAGKPRQRRPGAGRKAGYLSGTYAGKTHDKKVAEGEAIRYPRPATLSKDTGFQGYEPRVRQTRQPKKSRVAGS